MSTFLLKAINVIAKDLLVTITDIKNKANRDDRWIQAVFNRVSAYYSELVSFAEDIDPDHEIVENFLMVTKMGLALGYCQSHQFDLSQNALDRLIYAKDSLLTICPGGTPEDLAVLRSVADHFRNTKLNDKSYYDHLRDEVYQEIDDEYQFLMLPKSSQVAIRAIPGFIKELDAVIQTQQMKQSDTKSTAMLKANETVLAVAVTGATAISSDSKSAAESEPKKQLVAKLNEAIAVVTAEEKRLEADINLHLVKGFGIFKISESSQDKIKKNPWPFYSLFKEYNLLRDRRNEYSKSASYVSALNKQLGSVCEQVYILHKKL